MLFSTLKNKPYKMNCNICARSMRMRLEQEKERNDFTEDLVIRAIWTCPSCKNQSEQLIGRVNGFNAYSLND